MNKKQFGLLLVAFSVAGFVTSAFLYYVEGAMASATWSLLAALTLLAILAVQHFKPKNKP